MLLLSIVKLMCTFDREDLEVDLFLSEDDEQDLLLCILSSPSESDGKSLSSSSELSNMENGWTSAITKCKRSKKHGHPVRDLNP